MHYVHMAIPPSMHFPSKCGPHASFPFNHYVHFLSCMVLFYWSYKYISSFSFNYFERKAYRTRFTLAVHKNQSGLIRFTLSMSLPFSPFPSIIPFSHIFKLLKTRFIFFLHHIDFSLPLFSIILGPNTILNPAFFLLHVVPSSFLRRRETPPCIAKSHLAPSSFCCMLLCCHLVWC